MTSAIASPSTRALARQQCIDIDVLAADLGRETIGRDDIAHKTTGNAPGAAPGTDQTGYWDVHHPAYGRVSAEPMSRFAPVAAAIWRGAALIQRHHQTGEFGRELTKP